MAIAQPDAGSRDSYLERSEPMKINSGCCFAKGRREMKRLIFIAAVLVAFANVQAFAGILVSNGVPASILQFSDTGASQGTFASGGGLSDPFDMVFGPDGNLYVSSHDNNSIKRYNGTTGAYIDDFVPTGYGGLSHLHNLTFGADGNLYVSSLDKVLRYEGVTGRFIDNFASGSGLNIALGAAFGPDGNFYVSNRNADDADLSNILRFNGTTGTFIDVFASGSGLTLPRDLLFGPDGNLYVGNLSTHSIMRFNATTGAFIDHFASGGGLDSPDAFIFGPDGNLYVTSVGNDSVLRFHGTLGTFIDTFISGGLNDPSALLFNTDSTESSAVPEPASLAIWSSIGLVGLVAGWRRRGRQAI